MQKFTAFTAVAAPLPIDNCDTDIIIPARYLKTIQRSGLGKAAFANMRYNEDGSEKPDFVLNLEPYRHARIIVAGDNFGCGSSREHAPWALTDFGIRVVISTSFADIFHGNAFKNGLLPIVLPKEQVDLLMQDAQDGLTLTVDLEKQQIVRGNRGVIDFQVDPFRRHCLLEGLDDIGLTMQHKTKIDLFETGQKTGQPWLYGKAQSANKGVA